MSERCAAWVLHRYDRQAVTQCSKRAKGQLGGIEFCSQHLKSLSALVSEAKTAEGVARGAAFDKDRMTFADEASITPRQTFTLYRMFNACGELLYVGISGRGVKRFTEHRNMQHWWREVGNIKTEHFDFEREAREAETAAIENERPRYNVVHSSGSVRGIAR